jgi:hypothetical protein
MISGALEHLCLLEGVSGRSRWGSFRSLEGGSYAILKDET